MTRIHIVLYGALLLAGLPDAGKVDLKPATVEAFDRYVRTAEARLDPPSGNGAFLWVDGSPDRRRQVQQGKILAQPWTGNGDLEIPDGLIHDWIGAVFVPGETLDTVLAVLQDYDHHKNIYKPEVVDSKLLSRDGDHFRVYLRLKKTQIVTVVLATEHDAQYTRLDAKRCASRSHSTRIAELDNPGKKDERELPPGHDHGFLWRLNSYWRLEERDGGVYVECEAISLTRNVPVGLGWLINPIIRGLPRDSLANTLRATRDAAGRK